MGSTSDIKQIIVVDKPHGITSMQVIRVLKRILKPFNITRIGHAGTLDPFATGVLVVGIGRSGTRQLGILMDQKKEYECEIDLLKKTFSGDMENFNPFLDQVDEQMINNIQIPVLEQIDNLLKNKFTGQIKQIPPCLSAISVKGKKAYWYVHKNIPIEMQPRYISIYDIKILKYEFPILKLNVTCSKGTYIRTLGQDIGRELGLWGTIVYLRRTKSGSFSLTDALKLDEISIEKLII